ncbi:MAG TPA: alpha/beta hydrolase [Candidatus Angelobacter sp.]|nr:alpha/beta hydrolase [Candidatus Angelobacter sp.]
MPYLALILFTSLLFQQPNNIETLHRTIQIDNATYDAILTKPASPGRHPAVFVIGGLGCYSLDNLPPDHPYSHLLDGLTERGFVTMRVDKNGEGKSGGPPCDSPQSDLQLAVRRSVAGLDALASYDFVNRDRIFIFAHSIGPLEGVLVAQKLDFHLRGFLAVETIGHSWMEYTLDNARRQTLLLGRGYDQADRAVRKAERCQYRFLIEKQTPEQVIKELPECKDSVRTFGVSATYLQQIADLDPAVEWKKVDVPVLVTYGTSDPTTSAEESHYLVTMINSFHPGRAEYMEFAGMGHTLDRSPSARAWLEAIQKQQQGEFDSEFLERVANWIQYLVNEPTPK